MENDFRAASKRFWTTIRHLRRGKQCIINTVYGGDGALLTSTRDVVDRWKEYFEDLLNPTDMPSGKEAGPGDSGVGSPISGAEVAEVVRKLLGGRAPGVDEGRLEFLKALDVVGLSWLTRLCSIAVDTLSDSITSDGVQDSVVSFSSTLTAPAPPPETGHQPKRWLKCWGRLRLPKRKKEQKLVGGKEHRKGGKQLSMDTRTPQGDIQGDEVQAGPSIDGALVQGAVSQSGGVLTSLPTLPPRATPAPPPETGHQPKRWLKCWGRLRLPKRKQEQKLEGRKERLGGQQLSMDTRTPQGDIQGDGVQAGPSIDGALVQGAVSQSGGVLTSLPTLPPLTEQQLDFLGLPNLGQSCYLNSALQSLLTLGVFSEEIEQMQWAWSSLSSAELLRDFVAIKASRRSGDLDHKTALLRSFKKSIAQQDPEFKDNGQKDAHEFLICVLNQVRTLSPLLKSAALRTLGRTYTCPVETHLLFHMLSTRTCKGCDGQSSSKEAFTNLSLDLEPEGSVSQALDRYLTESSLEYTCRCGAKESGMRPCFLTLPNVLVLHLKRFRFTLTGRLEKVADRVLLSRELELSCGTGTVALSQSCSKYHIVLSSVSVFCTHEVKYTLVSVLSHKGTGANSGHYISEGAYQGGANDLEDQWLCYNDLNVSQTTGRAVRRHRQRTAYLLFYQRQNSLGSGGGQGPKVLGGMLVGRPGPGSPSVDTLSDSITSDGVQSSVVSFSSTLTAPAPPPETGHQPKSMDTRTPQVDIQGDEVQAGPSIDGALVQGAVSQSGGVLTSLPTLPPRETPAPPPETGHQPKRWLKCWGPLLLPKRKQEQKLEGGKEGEGGQQLSMDTRTPQGDIQGDEVQASIDGALVQGAVSQSGGVLTSLPTLPPRETPAPPPETGHQPKRWLKCWGPLRLPKRKQEQKLEGGKEGEGGQQLSMDTRTPQGDIQGDEVQAGPSIDGALVQGAVSLSGGVLTSLPTLPPRETPAPPPETGHQPKRWLKCWGPLRLPKRKQEQKLEGGKEGEGGQQLSMDARTPQGDIQGDGVQAGPSIDGALVQGAVSLSGGVLTSLPTLPPRATPAPPPETGHQPKRWLKCWGRIRLPKRKREQKLVGGKEHRKGGKQLSMDARTPQGDIKGDGVQAGPSIDGALVQGAVSQSGGVLTSLPTLPPRATPAPPPETGHQPKRWSMCWGRLRLPKRKREQKLVGGKEHRKGGKQLSMDTKTPQGDIQGDGVQAGPSIDGALVQGAVSQSGGVLTSLPTLPPSATPAPPPETGHQPKRWLKYWGPLRLPKVGLTQS
ncbi:Ubiquitin carboxyl-terminal hydrolase 37 [Merluccius polli]|uniref:Ubiquitin carboxyl-terminal hydrolase 37 n=1 Tax=Merluccius polli TaxID=89951 RepID=A0AA47NNR7_MERPO|nr:Ubiquitin carboxyl-terminal hydrolase 37 [Merluccius polli]